MFLNAYEFISHYMLKILQKNWNEAQRSQTDAEILSLKITLTNKFIQNIESKKLYYDYEFLKVREKKTPKEWNSIFPVIDTS